MKGWMKAIIWVSLIFGAIFGVMRYVFLDFYEMPDTPLDPRSWANSPNVEPGDMLMLWRTGGPHIGELVMCSDPQAPDKWMIARVIGSAGDHIVQTDTDMRVNNFRIAINPCSQPPRKVTSPEGGQVDFSCYSEEVSGAHHDVNAQQGNKTLYDVKVEPGKIFLLTDTRTEPYAYDSRMPEVGQRPVEQCPNRVMMRLWSKAGWSDSDRRLGWLF